MYAIRSYYEIVAGNQGVAHVIMGKQVGQYGNMIHPFLKQHTAAMWSIGVDTVIEAFGKKAVLYGQVLSSCHDSNVFIQCPATCKMIDNNVLPGNR